jgi:kexin
MTVAVIDSGLDMDSLDPAPNYYANGSFVFNEGSYEPRPRLETDTHGTCCAAEIATSKNTLCGIGVAYNSRVAGLRLLSAAADEIAQASALNYDFHC